MSDLTLSLHELQEKQAAQSRAFRYYSGQQVNLYLTERIQELFQNLLGRFVENWCAPVIDVCADRIQLSGFSVANDEQAQSEIDTAWRSVDLAVAQDDVHEAALIAGESFLIAWLDPETGEIQAHYHDPRKCHVQYNEANPARKRFAAKWWEDESSESCNITLYYPDRVETYSAKKKSDASGGNKAADFALTDTAPNQFGVIPVFHFKNKRGCSDLHNVIPLQDAINKLFSDLIVSSEFAVLPQRYIITNADTTSLKNGPGQLWSIPAGDGVGQGTQAGQFAPADLSSYYNTITNLVEALSSITQTPRHMFLGAGQVPSGEALIALEAPLIKKARDRIIRFAGEWRAFASFLLLLRGIAIRPTDIEPVFADPSTVQPLTQAQTRASDVQSGIPLRTALRRGGWSQSEIDQMDQDAADAAQAQQTSMASALLSAQRQFDQGTQGSRP